MKVPSKNGDPLAVPSLFLAPSVFGNGFSGLQIIVDGVETNALDLSSSSVKNVAVDQNPFRGPEALIVTLRKYQRRER